MLITLFISWKSYEHFNNFCVNKPRKDDFKKEKRKSLSFNNFCFDNIYYCCIILPLMSMYRRDLK